MLRFFQILPSHQTKAVTQAFTTFYANCANQYYHLGEQGWRSGERASLPPMCPGFDSRTRRHMLVEFVVGSLLCSERFFSGYSRFPVTLKTNISKFQFDPGMPKHF